MYASESKLTTTDRCCPICLLLIETPEALQSHIALHLERISLFSLQRAVGEDDNANHTDADQVNANFDGSRYGDFEGDLKFIDEDELGSSGGGDIGVRLLHAAMVADKAVVRHLLMEDANPNTKNALGMTPLSWAARNGNEAIAKLLLEKGGVDLNSRDNNGQTPLSWAARNGNKTIAELLLNKDGVDLNSEDNNEQTPLSWEAEGGHEDVVKLLLTMGSANAVAFSLEARLGASASSDKTVKLWDVATGTAMQTLRGHSSGVSGIAFSPDARLVASSSWDSTIRLWDIATGAATHTLDAGGIGLNSKD